MTDEIRTLLAGATDLYVHASPDLLPRRWTDVELAQHLQTAGLRGAVHRHHYEGTAARCTRASAQTGFALAGSLTMNPCAGGFDAAVVEGELRQGAVWVGLPTLSGTRFHDLMLPRDGEPDERSVNYLAAGLELAAVDEYGNPVPELREVMRLVAEHASVFGVGYYRPKEIVSVVRDAVEAGVSKIVLTAPTAPWMRLDRADIEHLLGLSDAVWLEICAVELLKPSSDEVFRLLQETDEARVVISSDGGGAVAPEPQDQLLAACEAARAGGVSLSRIGRFIRDNPASLIFGQTR